MNLKKAGARFRRAWEAQRLKLIGVPPYIVSVECAASKDYDLFVIFNRDMTSFRVDLEKTGVSVFNITANYVALSVPTEWVSAPTRLLVPETPADRLHNALLDAGIADWIDVVPTDVASVFRVELIETLTFGQLAALKVGYEVLFKELGKPEYTMSERTTEIPTGAALRGATNGELLDRAKVAAKLLARWEGSGRGGKVDTIEHTDDPRTFVVTTKAPVPMNNRLTANFIETKEVISPKRTRVFIGDPFWESLVDALKPVTPEPPTPIVDEIDPPLPEPTPEPPALDEREVEIAALKAIVADQDHQIAALKAQLAAMHAESTEWQTLRLSISKDARITTHAEIAEQEVIGWKVQHFQYASNSADVLFVTMKREPSRRIAWRPVETASANSNGYHAASEPLIITPVDQPAYSQRARAMIDEMNAEIEPHAKMMWNTLLGIGERQ